METFSNSRLTCFSDCPLKFKYHYIDEIETEIEETVEAFMGSRVHEALEKLYKDLKFQKMLSADELIAFYSDSWDRNWNEAILIVRDEYSQSNYKKMGDNFLRDYYKRYAPFDQGRTIALEMEEKVNLNEKYDIWIRIDRLAIADDHTYEIHDYKTSNSLPTQDDLDNDQQLAIYAFGVRKMYPDAEKVVLIWHYLAFDKEMRSVRSIDQLETLRLNVLEQIRKIEAATEYPPKVSGLCNWCVYQPMCPEWKHESHTEKLPANEFLKEEGVNLVNMYASTKDQVDHLTERFEKIKEAMVHYTKQHAINRIFGSDVIASVRTYPKLSFPKKSEESFETFKNMVKAIGLWDQLSTVDVYELAKMINNQLLHPDQIKILDSFIEKGTTVKVYLNKKK